MLASEIVSKDENAVSSLCWDGLSIGEISEVLEDIIGCVPKTVEVSKGVVPQILETVLCEEPKI